MPETLIKRTRGLHIRKTISEMIEYRELLWMLAWRDFRIKYAQTFLGLIWAVIEPLLMALLLSLVFNKVASASTYGIEPILFGMVGMVSWNYFSNVVSEGNTSLILAQNMIKKIYFPRIIIPLSKTIAALPDLIVTLVFTLVLILFYQPEISANAWMTILFLGLTILAAASLGLWFSALNIRFRDFKHIVPFLIRIGLFITPIGYSTISIDSAYKWLFYLNPMTGIIEGFRWALFGLEFSWPYFYISISVLFFLFVGGFLFFNQMQKNMADII